MYFIEILSSIESTFRPILLLKSLIIRKIIFRQCLSPNNLIDRLSKTNERNFMKKIMAIVPARGGSKSIPKKNLALLAGNPLIAYTIKTAINSKMFDSIIVSTDSKEIAKVSMSFGAQVPFIRPKHLATDQTPGVDPIIHAITWMKENKNYCPDCIMCLQPTSPLRNEKDIIKSIKILTEKSANSVVSVTTIKHHPFWMKKIDKQGYMHDFVTQEQPIHRRQDLPSLYALNGAIYATKTNLFLEVKSWFPQSTYAYIMPPERSVDIDTPWDLQLAGLVLNNKQKNS